ncbi:hypothetical protein LBMAG53_23090 [Planctomycetota bacterium]|nr:hypothetical protein LBMAG53_23090 [Planctomycetota bacterium]
MSTPPPTKTVAIYCRKSTEDGLDSEFNSLDAQRQCCEQFAASQRHDGWAVSPERYDDGGWSGSTTDRPALKRLMAEVEAGKVQVIAVYKLDRLSRSLADFVGLLQLLEKHQVAFVSVTQHFNSATPMGRLTLNILICFAQFERENMIERVRDKVAATKRMGKWCGGRPSLGYDVAPGGRKLLVNEAEADRVRQLFALYLEHRSVARVLRVFHDRGWTAKGWANRKGRQSGGQPFTKSALAHTLGNILYTGRILYKGEIYAAEHPAIIDIATWEQVQNLMVSQRASGGAESRTRHFPLLKGLLRCKSCGCGMTYTYTKRGARLYGYYACHTARIQGAATCPMPSLPAAEVERLVVEEITAICRDPFLSDRVINEASVQHAAMVEDLRARSREAEALATKAMAACARAPTDAQQLALRRQADSQAATLRRRLAEAEQMTLDRSTASTLLRSFEPIWAELAPKERQELLRKLLSHITIDGEHGSAAFNFTSDGIAALASRGSAA